TLPSSIYLIAWIVAVVFAVKMVRNGGGRPERFLLIGISLMLAASVIGSATAGISGWLFPSLAERGIDFRSIAQVFSAISIIRACIGLAGIVLLVYAFWQKFRARPIPAEANLGSQTT
ncbi:unnamed protein product, partial [marine sediment metagenome]